MSVPHLIRQAAHEIGVNRDGTNPIDIATEGEAHKASFRNRHGDKVGITLADDATFKTIHEALRKAWREKA
ncbi:MAG: hypothetical protein IT537_25280 [Hyphomicrobiales bacterium]|nr:hypothetical protein [Hyphomicrobiales bacterium]